MSTAPNPNYALASFAKAGNFYDSALLSSGDGVVSRMGTVAMGQPRLYRGQIVNIDPVTSSVIPAVLGTSAPNAIVAENCDPTLSLQHCLVYTSAQVKYDQLIWPPTGSRTAIIDALRTNDILVEHVMLPSGQTTGMMTPVTLTPAIDTELAPGGNGNFAVAMLGGTGTWYFTQDDSSAWITVTSPTKPQTANGSVNYTVAANGPGQPARTGRILVNGQVYTVNQAAGTLLEDAARGGQPPAGTRDKPRHESGALGEHQDKELQHRESEHERHEADAHQRHEKKSEEHHRPDHK